MPRGVLTVPVYGAWSEVTDDGTPGEERRTPGPVWLHTERAYEFLFVEPQEATDADVRRLVDAVRIDALRAVTVTGAPGVGDGSLKALAGLPGLETLTLSGTAVTDEGLAAIPGYPRLRALDLSHCRGVTDRGLAHLGRAVGLRFLALTDTAVTDAGVRHLSGLAELECVSLNGCPALTDRSAAVLAALPSLARVGLGGAWQLTDWGLGRLAAMPRLASLDLCDTGTWVSRLAGRLLRWAGGPGGGRIPARGLFSAASVARVRAAHPGCDVSQPSRYGLS